MTNRTITPTVETSPISRKRKLPAEYPTAAPSQNNLSACEKEFLKRLAQGDSYKEIAAGMDVSINTVRDYVRAVYKKLEVNSRTKAVVKFLGGYFESVQTQPAEHTNHVYLL